MKKTNSIADATRGGDLFMYDSMANERSATHVSVPFITNVLYLFTIGSHHHHSFFG